MDVTLIRVKESAMSEKRRCMLPYDDYQSAGPFWMESTKRFMMALVPVKGVKAKNLLLPYARYIYSVANGVRLASSLQVDHVDGDRTHDVRTNLQVLTGAENRLKSMVERKSQGTVAEMVCPDCRGMFFREKRQTHLAKKGEFTACSRKCAGRFRKKLQDARAEHAVRAELTLKDLMRNNFVRWINNQNPTGKVLVEHKMVAEPWDAVSTAA